MVRTTVSSFSQKTEKSREVGGIHLLKRVVFISSRFTTSIS